TLYKKRSKTKRPKGSRRNYFLLSTYNRQVEQQKKFYDEFLVPLRERTKRLVGCDPGSDSIMMFAELVIDRGGKGSGTKYHFENRLRYKRSEDCYERRYAQYSDL